MGHGIVSSTRGELEASCHCSGDEKDVGVAGRGDEVDSETLDVVDRVRRCVDLPIASIARAGVQVADMEGAPEDLSRPTPEILPAGPEVGPTRLAELASRAGRRREDEAVGQSPRRARLE